jgi:hypothetical protein
MPTATLPVILISLIVVLSSSGSSSRRAVFVLAVVAPVVVTMCVWLFNAFMLDDYALGWRYFVGCAFIVVASAAISLLAAFVITQLKRGGKPDDPADN